MCIGIAWGSYGYFDLVLVVVVVAAVAMMRFLISNIPPADVTDAALGHTEYQEAREQISSLFVQHSVR